MITRVGDFRLMIHEEDLCLILHGKDLKLMIHEEEG